MSRKKNDESSFVFYRSFYDAICLISDERLQQKAFKAICEYAFHGIEPADDADVLVKMVFTQAKPQLDANARRRESGKTGGRKTKCNLENGVRTMSESQTEHHRESKTETDGFENENQCEIITEPNVNANANVNVNENQNKNVNVNGKAGQTHFTPPTLTQILDYLVEKELTIDAERFIDYYTSNGWMIGKNQMRDWKAAVRSWARQDERFQQKPFMQNTSDKRNQTRTQKGNEHDGNNEKMEPQFGLCL